MIANERGEGNQADRARTSSSSWSDLAGADVFAFLLVLCTCLPVDGDTRLRLTGIALGESSCVTSYNTEPGQPVNNERTRMAAMYKRWQRRMLFLRGHRGCTNANLS